MEPKEPSPLDRLPTPTEIHAHMGRLYRELALLRRLFRLAQTARDQHDNRPAARQRGVAHAG